MSIADCRQHDLDSSFTCVIADDEHAVLSRLKSAPFWQRLGIDVIAAEDNGQDAFESIQNLKPDFAVIDIRMPRLSGLEVLEKCSEAGLRTQVIVISGYDEFDYAKKALKFGAKAYVLKPIDFSELADELGILILKLDGERKVLNQKFSSTAFFRDLVEGRMIDSSLIRRMLPSLKEDITDTTCFVMVLLFTGEMSNAQYERMIPLMDSVLSETRHKIWFQDARTVVGIFNLSAETPFQVAASLLRLFGEHGYPEAVAGVGDVIPGLYQCSYSYGKALSALTYRIYAKETRIFSSLDICTVPPPGDNPLLKVDMAGAILALDRDRISACVRQFLDAVLYVPMPSPNYLYSLCHSFIGKVSSDLGPILPEDEAAVKSISGEIVQAESLDGIAAKLEGYFCSLADYIDRVYGSDRASLLLAKANGLYKEDDELVRKAKLFIRENIQNKIYISDVADHVNLSASYFAIYFKNKTGETLRDYLLHEKMEWAGKALLKKQVNVGEIAARLGYSDYHAFSRAFKKVYGQTPSNFRTKREK